MFGTKRTLCTACNKTVYKLEELRVDNHILHKECFKCAHCKRRLNLSSFAAVCNKLYCKTHYLELFRESGGTYSVFGDGGFKQQPNRFVPRSISVEEEETKKTEQTRTEKLRFPRANIETKRDESRNEEARDQKESEEVLKLNQIIKELREENFNLREQVDNLEKLLASSGDSTNLMKPKGIEA